MRDTKQLWFKQAKYGLFIHWGLYAILAGEYGGKRTDNIAEWIMNDLDIPVSEYEKLAAQFNPIKFNADEYVKMAKDWGVKYLTFTAKHHDGFAMYHSKCSPYNIVEASPFGRDIVKELAEACAKYEIKFCLYYSQAQDWHHPDGYWANHDNSNKTFRRYLDEKCIPQIKELLTGYGEIGMIWFDTPMDMTAAESRELFELVKSIQPNCIVSGRIGNDLGEYMTTGDNDVPALPFYGDWEVPATLNDTWGFNRYDKNWKQAGDILRLMVKINSRGGNYLLNVGPDCEGVIPAESVAILNEVGGFLRKNGDSIYETNAIDPYVYDVDGCFFTAKPHRLFIHLLKPISRLNLNNIENKVKRVYLLDSGAEVPFKSGLNCEGEPYWRFTLPESAKPETDRVICVEIEEETPIFQPLR